MGNKAQAGGRAQEGENDDAYQRAAEKAHGFPQSPGVYLMKDNAGRVIYVGKAKNLRSRASSYFLKGASEDRKSTRLNSSHSQQSRMPSSA